MDLDYYREAVIETITQYENEEDIDETDPSAYIIGLL